MLSSFRHNAVQLASRCAGRDRRWCSTLQGAAPSLADAVLYGRASVVQTLIAGGADVNERDDDRDDAADGRGRRRDRRRSRGCSSRPGPMSRATTEDGATALMRAASANRGEAVRLLIARGADVNAKSAGGMTALMVAAFGGYSEPCARCSSTAPIPTPRTTRDAPSLMAAVTGGDAAVVQALLARRRRFPRVADAGGVVAMTYAAAAGATGAIEALMKRGAKPSGGDLMAAATECHAPAVRLLLASGLKPDEAVGGRTPLLAAASERCVDAVTAAARQGRRHQRQRRRRPDAAHHRRRGRHARRRARAARSAAPTWTLPTGSNAPPGCTPSMANREEMAALFKEARDEEGLGISRDWDWARGDVSRVSRVRGRRQGRGPRRFGDARRAERRRRRHQGGRVERQLQGRAGGHGRRQDHPPLSADWRHRRRRDGRVERGLAVPRRRTGPGHGIRPRRRARRRVRRVRARARRLGRADARRPERRTTRWRSAPPASRRRCRSSTWSRTA